MLVPNSLSINSLLVPVSSTLSQSLRHVVQIGPTTDRVTDRDMEARKKRIRGDRHNRFLSFATSHRPTKKHVQRPVSRYGRHNWHRWCLTLTAAEKDVNSVPRGGRAASGQVAHTHGIIRGGQGVGGRDTVSSYRICVSRKKHLYLASLFHVSCRLHTSYSYLHT